MLVTLLLTTVAMEVWASPPQLNTILPRGASRGDEVTVTIHGRNLANTIDLLFHDTGIEFVEVGETADNRATVTLRIAEDCPVGPQAVRVRTAQGVSNLCLFSVGALIEVEEEEPNDSTETAQPIELGTTVNGRVTNEDVDYFAVDLAEGQVIAVEVEGIRLGGALFDPMIRLFGPQGHERLTADDTPLMQQDTAFAYTAIEDGTHYIAVSEAAYGGSNNSYYRLHVGSFPRPLSASPLGGNPGETIAVQWLGDPRFAASEDGEPALVSVALPDGDGTTPVTVSMDAGVIPTPFPFRLSELPVTLEAAPNDSHESATLMQAPGAGEGVIREPGEVDFFAFEAAEGAVYDIRVWARALGSPLDSVLHVFNPDGSELGNNDDGAGMDSLLRVTIPAEGRYTLTVRDHLGRGGDTFAYRVEITPITPSFSLAIHENDEAILAIPQGNRAFVMLRADRTGWDAPANLALNGLPEGLTAGDLSFPQGQRIIPAILEAAPEAPLAGALVDFVATPQSDDIALTGRLEQAISLVTGRNQTVFLDREVNHFAVAVVEPAPFRVAIARMEAPIVRNGTKHIRITAERDEDFTGEIKVKMPWAPPGFAAPEATIPEGESEVRVQLQARNDVQVGENQIVFEAQAAGHRICTPFTPVMVEEPWVAFEPPTVETEQGQDIEFVFKLAVNHAFEGAFPLVLNGLPRGLTTTPQEINAETGEVRFPIAIAEDAPVGTHDNLQLVASIEAVGEEVVHLGPGGSIRVYEPLPAALQEVQAEPEPEAAEDESVEEEAAPEPEPKRRTRFPQA